MVSLNLHLETTLGPAEQPKSRPCPRLSPPAPRPGRAVVSTVVPLRAVLAKLARAAGEKSGTVGGADGALAKGAFEMGKGGCFFFLPAA